MNECANFVFKGDLSETSVCTSFVSQHLNQSAVVEIRLDSANIAEVLVNGDVINFDESLSYQFQGKYSYLKCFFTLRLLYLLLHVIPILCRTGVSVIQSPPVTLDAEATEKVYQVSFTSGISFQTTASSNVLNIIPVVGNTLLSGAFFSFSYQTYHSQFVSFDFIVSMYGNKIEKKNTSRTLERTSG